MGIPLKLTHMKNPNLKPSFDIHFDHTSLNVSETGSITGIFSVKFGGRYFPVKEWSDFPEAVVMWWLTVLEKIEPTGAYGAKVPFFDGPYSLIVCPYDPDRMIIAAVDRNQDKVVFSAIIEREVLIKKLQSIGLKIIKSLGHNVSIRKKLRKLKLKVEKKIDHFPKALKIHFEK